MYNIYNRHSNGNLWARQAGSQLLFTRLGRKILHSTMKEPRHLTCKLTWTLDFLYLFTPQGEALLPSLLHHPDDLIEELLCLCLEPHLQSHKKKSMASTKRVLHAWEQQEVSCLMASPVSLVDEPWYLVHTVRQGWWSHELFHPHCWTRVMEPWLLLSTLLEKSNRAMSSVLSSFPPISMLHTNSHVKYTWETTHTWHIHGRQLARNTYMGDNSHVTHTWETTRSWHIHGRNVSQ